MSRRTKDRNFWDSAMMNNATYIQYYNRLTELAISMFEWINLPEEIDPRFLELVLFAKGKAIFFKDPDIGYMALMVSDMGPMNVYRIPLRRRAYASNGYNAELTIDDSVMIYNNYLRTPSKLDVEMFSRRLYNIDRTIDINVNGQKTPILIECEETQRLTLQNLYMQYDGNQPVIFGDNALQNTPLKAIQTGVPYVADKLTMLKTQYWNEALTYLGISNLNIQKKERLVSDEVARNLGGVIASRYSRLNARKEACEKINDMFGLDVDVEYRDDFREQDDEFMLTGVTSDDKAVPMYVDIRSNNSANPNQMRKVSKQ
ncbi:MAG: hypothetical protein J6T10_00305 [Methanobrevibacter sp.]|nr:hypothetical protein [Methanobrevibacter sp.]